MIYSLEPYLKKFFYWYGGFVYRFRWPCFIIPLIITPLCGIGFYWFKELRVDDPAFVFTPRDARWKTELFTFARLWPMNENKFIPGKSFEMKRFVNILCKSKDGGNILRPEILDEIELLNQYISQNITVTTYDGKYNLTYQDLCLSYDWVCGSNEHIRMFREMTRVGKVIDLTFPKGGNKDTPAYLGTAIGDITLNKTDNSVLEAKVTQLFFFLKQESPSVLPYSTDFEYQVEKFLLHAFQSDLITISFAHYQSLEDGLHENAAQFVPNFVLSFTALSLFCLGCSFVLKHKRRSRIDWIRSKPYIACAGLLNTLMSLISGFGLMMLLGMPYNVINSIIPFVLIAIGIDDMFIMNASWDQTDRSLPIESRMQEMMSDAGVAVSITNITDILSFAIGCITSLPGIFFFSSYAFTAVSFCYVFQLTYFAGFMAIMGNIEAEKRHCMFFYKVNESEIKKKKKKNIVFSVQQQPAPKVIEAEPPKQPLDDTTTFSSEELEPKFVQSIYIAGGGNNLDRPGTIFHKSVPMDPEKLAKKLSKQQSIPNRKAVNFVHRFFAEKFAPFILNDYVRTGVVVVYIGYALVAWWGCMNFKEGLQPSNLVMADHYLAKYFADLKAFWQYGPQLHVAIKNPPNLTDSTEREKLMALVRAFENTQYSMGREGTVFFFLEYLNYLDQLNAELENTDRIWHTKLRSWLKYTGGSNNWDSDIVYNETTHEFKAFRFQIAIKNILETSDHKSATAMFRDIADSQPFEIDVYHEMFPFADQYLMILPSTIQNVILALVCMIAIAFLLIPSIPSAFLIVVAILSIDIGVFGYMTWWGVNLDAVSMISLIMSIGFAVDLCAHIVYAFISAEGSNERERVIGALEHLGWPIFQGATSTIVGVSVLYSVNAYIILTFFKTIWLTMFLGMVHGLIFLPVFLSFIPISFFRLTKEQLGL